MAALPYSYPGPTNRQQRRSARTASLRVIQGGSSTFTRAASPEIEWPELDGLNAEIIPLHGPVRPLRSIEPTRRGVGDSLVEADQPALQRVLVAHAPRRAHSARMARRRLRALACGVLTVAVLVGVYVGAGALRSTGQGGLQVLPGSVRVANGYLYRVQPGETLWSIATRLDPTGDPRQLVDQLNQQIGGAPLQVGMELRLP